MTEHVSDRLSPYLDDELSAAERAAIEAHLGACAACAADLDALRRLVARAGLVSAQDAPPARDLWTGIRARIEAAPAGAGADRPAGLADADRPAGFARAAERRRTAPRRVSLTIAQLAAAAALLVAVSGTAAWLARGRTPATAPAATIQAEVEPSAAGVRLVDFADAQYDAAVTDLERALEERRNDLHPRTVEVLERNLKLIDAAIAQARQALDEDPGNTYLSRHLVESRRRKLDLLRRAAFADGN